MGCLNSAPSSSDYGNHASIRRQRRQAGVANSNAVSRFAAWPSFGRPRRAIHSVSHACDLQNGAPAERYPKTTPKNLSKSTPGDRLVTKQAERVADVGSML